MQQREELDVKGMSTVSVLWNLGYLVLSSSIACVMVGWGLGQGFGALLRRIQNVHRWITTAAHSQKYIYDKETYFSPNS